MAAANSFLGSMDCPFPVVFLQQMQALFLAADQALSPCLQILAAAAAALKDGPLSILMACSLMGPWPESSHPSAVMATATALLILQAMAVIRTSVLRFVVAALFVQLCHLFDQFIVSAVADSVLQYVLCPALSIHEPKLQFCVAFRHRTLN
jgi:hypothetical protein